MAASFGSSGVQRGLAHRDVDAGQRTVSILSPIPK